jgi:hypothetical protein
MAPRPAISTPSPPTRWRRSRFPFAADTCTFMDGRFIIQKHTLGQFGWSPPTTARWDALDFATAESDPDNLVRVMADSGILLLFGDRTTEFWGDSGAADQPFSRIGASAIEWGLAARWSLCKFDGSLMFLRRNKLGAVQVCMLTGNQATPVPRRSWITSSRPMRRWTTRPRLPTSSRASDVPDQLSRRRGKAGNTTGCPRSGTASSTAHRAGIAARSRPTS